MESTVTGTVTAIFYKKARNSYANFWKDETSSVRLEADVKAVMVQFSEPITVAEGWSHQRKTAALRCMKADGCFTGENAFVITRIYSGASEHHGIRKNVNIPLELKTPVTPIRNGLNFDIAFEPFSIEFDRETGLAT